MEVVIITTSQDCEDSMLTRLIDVEYWDQFLALPGGLDNEALVLLGPWARNGKEENT